MLKHKTQTKSKAEPLAGHRTALTFLVAAYALSVADRMILAILFPDIKAEFDLSDTQLGLLGGLTFALFYATLGLPIARLADQFNRKLIVITSLVIFSVMTGLSGWASGFMMLLILRMGVGIGEAGVNPASHSMIADYFPPERRSFAMSLLAVGASLGMMTGFAGGGAIAEAYNWRVALMWVGFPGVILAIAMALWFREPPRGAFDGDSASAPPTLGNQANATTRAPSILNSALTMWRNPALRHLVIASTITGMISYGLTQWLPTFFTRTHGLSASQVGILMALFFGFLGLTGALVCGKLTDRLAAKGFQYGPWLVSAAMILATPFWIAAMFAENFMLTMGLLLIPAFTANFFLGPSLALVQTLSPVPMRAVASAIKMLCLNLIGLGLGPLMVGVLSDLFQTRFADTSLNMAIAVFSLFGFWGAYHYYVCGKLLAEQRA